MVRPRFPFSSFTLTSLTLLISVAACGEDDPDLGTYFQAEPFKDKRCMSVDDRLSGRREVRIFRSGRNVDVVGSTRGLQRYYLRHGLQFFATSGEQEIVMHHAIDDRPVAFKNALAAQFPGVNLDDSVALMKNPALWAEVQRAVGAFILGPIIEFARAHGTVGVGATNLVLVPEILTTGWATGANVLGLAISPALLKEFTREGAPDAAFWHGLNLSPDFTPMLFLHGPMMRQLGESNPMARDITVAHEFGHTGGLVHQLDEDDFANLMYPSVDAKLGGCDQTLLDGQLVMMQRSLGVGPAPTVASTQALNDDHAAHPAVPRPPSLHPRDLPALLSGDPRPLLRVLAPVLHRADGNH
jgi:hypothetical protein